MERITYQELPTGMFDKLREIEEMLAKTSIEHRLAELMKLRASQLNGCAYCVDMHYKELKHAGEDELRLSSVCVWEETPYFSDQERAVLKYTEALTQITPAPLADEVYNPLLNYFSKQEISYLTLIIAQINTWNRLMKAFRFTPGRYEVAEKETVA